MLCCLQGGPDFLIMTSILLGCKMGVNWSLYQLTFKSSGWRWIQRFNSRDEGTATKTFVLQAECYFSQRPITGEISRTYLMFVICTLCITFLKQKVIDIFWKNKTKLNPTQCMTSKHDFSRWAAGQNQMLTPDGCARAKKMKAESRMKSFTAPSKDCWRDLSCSSTTSISVPHWRQSIRTDGS